MLCHITIAVSEKARNDIVWMPFIKNKVKVIYNGVAKFSLLPKEESRVILASHEANKIILLSISELHKNKGLDIALRTLSLLPKEIKEKIIYIIFSSIHL